MSVRVVSRIGAFEPQDSSGAEPEEVYTVLSGAELRDVQEAADWLGAAERTFDFRDNLADAVHDAQSVPSARVGQ